MQASAIARVVYPAYNLSNTMANLQVHSSENASANNVATDFKAQEK
jgi:hypothetical protein